MTPDIQQLLTQLTTQHLYALAVTLAAHVTPNQTINIPETLTTICRRHTRAAAELFDCDPSDIHSDKRTAHIAKARMVAMALTWIAVDPTTRTPARALENGP